VVKKADRRKGVDFLLRGASIKKLILSLDSIAQRAEHSVEFMKFNYYGDNCHYLDRRNIP
jgi:hypothetical protein